MKISFIIPALNEESTLGAVIDRLINLKLGIKKEIIIVNDGSIDETLNIAKKYEKNNEMIKVISHRKRKGKGASVRSGIRISSGDIVTIQDADLEYNILDFKRLISPILNKKAKVVYGSRFLKKNKKGYGIFYLGNRFLSFFTSLIYFKKITDMETCYKLIEGKLIRELVLKSNGFDIEPEITSKLLKRGIRIVEIPIDYNPRSIEEGKKINFFDGFKALFTLIKIRLF